MSDNDELVTLDDVATDRTRFAEARRYLKARAPIEWAFGGTVFSVSFAVGIRLLRPSSPLALYVIVVAASFLIAAVAVFLNSKERDKWYQAKAAELDSIERRIRSGERVLRPKPLMQPTGKKQPMTD